MTTANATSDGVWMWDFLTMVGGRIWRAVDSCLPLQVYLTLTSAVKVCSDSHNLTLTFVDQPAGMIPNF